MTFTCTFAKYILRFRVQRHLVYIHSYTVLCYVSHSLLSFALTITTSSTGLPMCLSAKESACQCSRCKRLGLDLWVGKISVLLQLGNGNPFQYSCLENAIGREAWWATVHGVTKSQMRLRAHTHIHTHSHTHTHTHPTRNRLRDLCFPTLKSTKRLKRGKPEK